MSPTSCRNKNFSGEVEDYTVNIVAERTVLVAPTSLKLQQPHHHQQFILDWDPADAKKMLWLQVHKGISK
jgi:hypothetical protein